MASILRGLNTHKAAGLGIMYPAILEPPADVVATHLRALLNLPSTAGKVQGSWRRVKVDQNTREIELG